MQINFLLISNGSKSLKFPTWSEFKEKSSEFQTEAVKKINEFKEKNPLADSVIQSLVNNIMPTPINRIILDIYNGSDGKDPEEKFADVKSYLKTIDYRGERRYEKIRDEIDEIMGNTECLKEIGKEQINGIKNILVYQGKNQQELRGKLESLFTMICRIEAKL